ncbi:DUF2332 domain-containing protein, partial [Actinophytocola sp.]|uniref:DUF2332 domain-containing protein n=1 Tax=Actinophytocola sp. TaxID=1872138 RepID=UPI002ED93093
AGLLTATDALSAGATLLFAAVQRVLQAEPFHELTNYYPSLGGSYGPDGGTWPLFRTFVLERADRVRELIATRVTQTNEVRRAALLYPAVAIAAKQAGNPVGLLEVGASAGLLLGMDTYAYRYQTEQAGQLAAGPARSTVGLHCALALAPGASLPSIPKKLTTAARIGLDAHPVDLTDEEQYAWLEACIWPDQPERLRLFGAAATAQRKSPPELVAGDAVEDLPAVAARIPAEVPLVVLTSNVLWLFDADRRRAFLDALDALAVERPLWWVSQEAYRSALEPLLPGRDDLRPGEGEATFGTLGLVRWSDGRPIATALAKTAWHGERMQWLV